MPQRAEPVQKFIAALIAWPKVAYVVKVAIEVSNRLQSAIPHSPFESFAALLGRLVPRK
jgi:hypothetical protein